MAAARSTHKIDDFWAIPEDDRFHELIGGVITRKASPSGEHADAQAALLAALRGSFHRSAGGIDKPGGWWVLLEVEILLDGEIARPDVLGWRRDRCPSRPTGTPVKQRPDWVCEVLSPSNASRDTVEKLRLYHRSGIPHYWIIDPDDATLTVMRWSSGGYSNVLAAEHGDRVRAEPFQQIELAVGTLFGDEPMDL